MEKDVRIEVELDKELLKNLQKMYDERFKVDDLQRYVDFDVTEDLGSYVGAIVASNFYKDKKKEA